MNRPEDWQQHFSATSPAPSAPPAPSDLSEPSATVPLSSSIPSALN